MDNFLYITGSTISEVESLTQYYLSIGYTAVGSMIETGSLFYQGVQLFPNYSYNTGINKGNNTELLSKNFRRRNGVIGNEITGSALTSDEINAYYGL